MLMIKNLYFKNTQMRIFKLKLFLIVFFMFGFFVGNIKRASAIVYLSAETSNDNQIQINEALNNESARKDGILSVYLKGGVYIISDSIKIGSNTILEGDANAVIKLVNSAYWPKGRAMIESKETSLSNVTIHNFQIDGNKEGNGILTCGSEYYDMMEFENCSNLEVFGMYLYNSGKDILKVTNCSGVKFHDNIIKEQGGTAVHFAGSSDVSAYNNNITISCGNGFRIYDSSGANLYNNIITSKTDSSWGIEMNSGNSGVINIYSNRIYSLQSSGIGSLGGGSARLNIHHNIIYDCKGGVLVEKSISDDSYEGVIIEFNTIVSNDGPAISTDDLEVLAQNNILAGNQGISGSFISRGNCFSDNSGATENAVTVDDPGFVDASIHDYHLKSQAGRWSGIGWVKDDSSSACIDRGAGVVSVEPYPNGCNPNPGRYGNTSEASLSGNVAPAAMPANPDVYSYYYLHSHGDESEKECYCASEDAASGDNSEEKNLVVTDKCSANSLCLIVKNALSGIGFLLKIFFSISLFLFLFSIMLHFLAPNKNNLIYKINLVIRYILLCFFVSFFLWLLFKGFILLMG